MEAKKMETKKKDAIMACVTFEDLLNVEYGEHGTEEREKFETEAETFCRRRSERGMSAIDTRCALMAKRPK